MVTMLAERMRTNPEDFVNDNPTGRMLGDNNLPKFYEIAQILSDMVADPKVKYYWFLSDTEKEMLIDAYRNLCRKRFEDKCMERLLGDNEEHKGLALSPTIIRAQGRYQTTPWIDPRIHLNSTQIEYCAKYGIDPESYAKLMATTHI